MMIEWKEVSIIALVLGVPISAIAFVMSGGDLSWALRGFGMGVCGVLVIAIIGAIVTRYYDCLEGDPF